MRNFSNSVGAMIAFLLLAATTALPMPRPAPKDSSNSIVIVFKDGHRQTFSLSDIARIEFTAPAPVVSSQGPSTGDRGHFIGKWTVGDGMGGTFLITLNSDGEAKRSIGSAHGTWVVENGAAVISWDDGWHDVIRRSGKKYQKEAYSPGKPLSEEPSNTAEAAPAIPN